MERLRPQEPGILRSGVSLKELADFIVKDRKGKDIPAVSKRIIWLSESSETPDFWIELNRHMAEDDELREKQSIGGIFTRKPGEKIINGTEWKWSQLFISLDRFLKQFDMRATEFIFRDFEPQNPDRNLAIIIQTTRKLAFDKYPRLRRLYLDDYEQLLKTGNFWRTLSLRLEKIPRPLANETFFGYTKVSQSEMLRNSDVKVVLAQTFNRNFDWVDNIPKKIKTFGYSALAQIVRDYFGMDLRTFLLNYNPPEQEGQYLRREIEKAKKLIEEKILPTREKTSLPTIIERNEFNETVQNKEFWSGLVSDIENHRNSKNQAYSLSNFLRHYHQEENEIDYATPGNYARLVTLYLRSTKGLRKKMITPSKKLVHHLMWEFKPSEELASFVQKAKVLCAEMFPQDCLYIILQTAKFWEEFQNDISQIQGEPSLYAFLRFFSTQNPTCNGRKYHPRTSKYQRLIHRAYHKEGEFLKFTHQLGIKKCKDFKEAIGQLFFLTCPEHLKPILIERFPKDFDLEEKEKRARSKKLLSVAKKIVKTLKDLENRELQFQNRQEAVEFRRKLWSAQRILEISICTDIKDSKITLRLGKRFLFGHRLAPRKEFEQTVKKLRLEGKQNKQIAEILGIEDHIVEHVAMILIKRGEIPSRGLGKKLS